MKGSGQTSPYGSGPIHAFGSCYIVVARPTGVPTCMVGPHMDGGDLMDQLGRFLMVIAIRRIFGHPPYRARIEKRTGWLKWSVVREELFSSFESAHARALVMEQELLAADTASPKGFPR